MEVPDPVGVLVVVVVLVEVGRVGLAELQVEVLVAEILADLVVLAVEGLLQLLLVPFGSHTPGGPSPAIRAAGRGHVVSYPRPPSFS